MTGGLPLGRIAGVPVSVHWSVLVIFGLIAGGLAAGRFPATYPGASGWAYAAAGVAAALVFLAGLLAHEVSHAVVAQRNGLPVEGITLWLFGGVARLQGEAPDPGAEVRIAGVGPLVSLLLSVAFGAAWAVATLSGAEGLGVAVLMWLAAINLALAAFNAIPAAPLDGGRLLRAALWKARGDRTWAAVVAARAGRVLGLVLIGLGLVQFFLGAGFGGLWLALIGWFLIGAAQAEERQAQLGDALAGVRVADVMSPDPTAAPGHVTVADFIDSHLFRHRFSTFPVLEGDRPVGLVTLGRVKAVPPGDRPAVRLGEIACPLDEVPVAAPEEELTDLLPRLGGCADGRALVVDRAGDLVGIVSPSDVARAVERSRLRGRAVTRV